MGPDGMPPQAVIMQMLDGKVVSRSIAVAADLGVADALKGGALDIDALAKKVGATSDALYRVLRLLARLGIFEEQAGRKFANTPVSEVLRGDVPGSLKHAARWYGADLNWSMWGKLGETVRSGKSGVEIMYPNQKVFEVLAKHPDQPIFNEAMTSWTSMESHAITASYDFNGYEHIVDVGGGHGALALAIAHATKTTKLTVFDLPHVIEGAQEVISAAGMAERVDTEAGSFEDGVPGPADCYVMKHIIHDWPDELCITILSHCREKMKDGGKVIVCEMLVTDGPEAMPALALDIEMLLGPGGRERSEAEFGALFAKAGLKLDKVVRTQSPICLIEASKA